MEEIVNINQLQIANELAIHSVISPQSDSIFVSIKPVYYNLNELYVTNKSLPKGQVILSTLNKNKELPLLSSNPIIYG